jgi:hypothetical protein
MVLLPHETPEEPIPTVQIEVDEVDFQLELLLLDYKPQQLVDLVKNGIQPNSYILDILRKRHRFYTLVCGYALPDIPLRQGKRTISIEEAREAIPLHENAIKELQAIQQPRPAITPPDTQAPKQGAAKVSQNEDGDDEYATATIKWLSSKDRQWIKHYTEEAHPVGSIENGIEFSRQIDESRISKTKTVAFIYRELVKAAKEGEIPLKESAIADFMINHLKLKDGKDITKDSLAKAVSRTNSDKHGQTQTK